MFGTTAGAAPKVAEGAPEAEGEQSGADRDFVVALARGLLVLRCFRRGDRFLGIREIARRTGLPKSTVARLAYTLTKLQYLDYSPAQEKYSLGVGVLSLSDAYLANLDIREVARPLMQALAEYSQAAVALGAPDRQGHMVFLEVCQGRQVFQMRLDVGARVPYGTTALGRAYLAAAPPAERAEILNTLRKLIPKDQWTAYQDALEQACEDYRRYGFCFSFGDWNKDVFAVGVPIVSRESGRIFAFSCSGPVFAMTRERLINDIGPRLVQMRDQVEAAVGGRF